MKKTILIFFVLLLLIPTFVFASNTKTVYLTAYGSKYHLYSCHYIKDIYYKTTVDKAEAQGYEPCEVCNPFGLANTNYKNTSDSSSISIDLPATVADFILCTILYLAIPILLTVTHLTWKSKKEVILFILAHNSFMYIFLTVINLLSNTLNNPLYIVYPFIYGFIIYFIFESHIEYDIPTMILEKEKESYYPDLPINWLNFFKYFGLPLNIFISIYSTLQILPIMNINNLYEFFVIIVNFIFIALT